MTGALGAGYQDWGRSFATSRFLNIPSLGGLIAGATVYGPFTTVNIDSLGIRAIAIVGHGSITLDWYADEGLTVFITSDKISVRQGGTFDQSVVVKGSFLKVTATPAPAANWTFTLVIYETTRSVIPSLSSVDNLLLFNVNVVLGAGSGTTIEAPRVVAAEATWTVFSPGADWNATLEAFDETGTGFRVDQYDQTRNKERRLVYLPPCTVRVGLVNNAAVAAGFNIMLGARPGLSGL